MSDAGGLDPDLLAILACPSCHSRVVPTPEGAELHCTGCSLAYPVRDGIPVMLLDQARDRASSGTGDA